MQTENKIQKLNRIATVGDAEEDAGLSNTPLVNTSKNKPKIEVKSPKASAMKKPKFGTPKNIGEESECKTGARFSPHCMFTVFYKMFTYLIFGRIEGALERAQTGEHSQGS